jgi:hypothetical protein
MNYSKKANLNFCYCKKLTKKLESCSLIMNIAKNTHVFVDFYFCVCFQNNVVNACTSFDMEVARGDADKVPPLNLIALVTSCARGAIAFWIGK